MFKLLVKDSAYYFLGSIAFQISGLISVILMMRALSVGDFGNYSYCVAFVTLFSFVADGGLSQYLIKKIAQNPESDVAIYRELQGAQVLISGSILISLGIFAFSLHPVREAITIFTLGFGVIVSGFVTPMFSVLIARGDKKSVVKKDILLSVGRLTFVLLICTFSPTVTAFSFGNLVLGSISVIFCLLLRRTTGNEFMFGYSLEWAGIKTVIREGMPFTILMLANIVYNRIDVIMLNNLAGKVEVGIYNGASQFVFPFMFVSSVLVTAIFPHLSRQAKSNTLFLKMSKSSFWLMTISGLLLSSVLFLFAELFFGLAFNHKFDSSIAVFKVLVWYLFIVFAYGTFSNILVVKNKASLLFKVTVVMLLLKILLNYVLIPGYGAMSAAITTLICEILLCAVTMVLAWKLS